MQIIVTLPDEIFEGLGGQSEAPRRVLEALVLQRYLAEEISQARLAELLSLSRFGADQFLSRHNARLPYTKNMLDQDRRNLAQMFGSR
jgi:predicted HTH domain antitoxin